MSSYISLDGFLNQVVEINYTRGLDHRKRHTVVGRLLRVSSTDILISCSSTNRLKWFKRPLAGRDVVVSVGTEEVVSL